MSLEPGGWLQWEEYDLYTQKVVGSPASASTENLKALSEYIKVQKPLEYEKSPLLFPLPFFSPLESNT